LDDNEDALEAEPEDSDEGSSERLDAEEFELSPPTDSLELLLLSNGELSLLSEL
jgi:hypothetical protein